MDESTGMTYTTDEGLGEGDAAIEQGAEDDSLGEESEAQGTEQDSHVTEPSQSSREVARLVNVIKNLQAENSRLKVEPGLALMNQGPTDQVPTHPVLDGLETDEHGNVLYHGSYVSPELAVEHYEQTQRLGEMEEALRAREESEHASQVQAAQKELFDVVQSTIVDMREQSLPGLSKEHSALADEYILNQADFVLTRALASGEELTPDLIERSGKEALAKAKQLFGVFGERQIRDNQEYADTYRVKPDGRPGTRTPLDESKLTKADRIRLAQERTRLAMAMRTAG